MSEFRYCKLTNEWTLFAPERLKRPINFMPSSKNSLAQDASSCPFDSGKEEYTPSEITRIAQKDAWQCRVVPNLYNALSLDHPFNSQRESYFEKMRGFGAHEVIIETPHHDRKMPSYDYNEFVNYLTIIQERAINLKKDIRLAHLSVFKNQGQEAGASLYHSHTQLMALPFVPKEFNTMIEDQKSYYKEHKRALLDDMIYEEQQYQHNIIAQNQEFIAYCPYASKYAFEVKIVSKKKLASIIEFDSNDISALSDILQEFFSKFASALGDTAFNMIFKNAPYEEYDEKTKEYYRFSIEIIPRIYKAAGFELDSSVYINVVLPEVAAKTYKGES